MQRDVRFGCNLLIAVLVLFSAQQVVSQTNTSGKPGTKVYKCGINGRVSFSDTPCPNPEQADIVPGRVEKSTGAERVAQSPALKNQKDFLAQATSPVKGRQSNHPPASDDPFSPNRSELKTRN